MADTKIVGVNPCVDPFPKRKNLRLKHWDYATPWWYFVTICTQDRRCFFGNVVGGKMVLNDVGKMVERVLLKLSTKFPVELDQSQIMPNHIHTIIIVGVDPRVDPNDRGYSDDGRTHGSAPTTLGDVIRWFKTMTTNYYIRGVKNDGWKPFNKRIWQRNYYEHIIRDERSLYEIRQYIKNNPLMWDEDRNNPKNF